MPWYSNTIYVSLLILELFATRDNYTLITDDGQRVMVVTEDPTKLKHGPYLINRIFTKGTIELQLNAGNSTTVY